MNKKHYIIWDWNGTLLNDVDVSIASINQLLKKESLPIFPNKEAYQRLFRFPIIQYYKDAGFDFKKHPFSELAKEYMEYYQPVSYQCSLHKGVKKTLQSFHEEGFVQVLLSASRRDLLMNQVQKYDILPYFKDILGLDDIHAFSKAELAKSYVYGQKENAASMVFVGDSVHDYEVARGANANCILVANGHEHKDKLLATQSVVVDTIQAINSNLILK